MKTLTKIFCGLLATTLLAAGCGDDSGGGGTTASADNPLVAALADDMLDGEDSMTDDRAEAECFAGRIVGGVGEDRLGALGVTADNVGEFDEIDFTDEEYDVVVDGLFDCIDLTEGMAESLAEELPVEDAQCVADALPEDLLRDIFSSSLRQSDEMPEGFLTAIATAYESCGVTPG